MGAATTMARGKLIGVRFSDDEADRVERLIAHYEAANPGVSFNAQMVIKAAIAIAERELGIAPAAPPSRPRTKAAPKKR